MAPLSPLLQIFLVALVLVAAGYDIRFRRIPNWLVLIGLIGGMVLNFALFQLDGLKAAGKGMGLALLIYFPFFALRAMGAGDVKLMAAVGAVVGPSNWFLIFICTGILGGVVAIILLLSKGRVRKTFWNLGFIVHELIHFRPPYAGREELDVANPKAVSLPHGSTIALGSIAFLIWIAVAPPASH